MNKKLLKRIDIKKKLKFLNISLNTKKMINAIDPSLYRSKLL